MKLPRNPNRNIVKETNVECFINSVELKEAVGSEDAVYFNITGSRVCDKLLPELIMYTVKGDNTVHIEAIVIDEIVVHKFDIMKSNVGLADIWAIVRTVEPIMTVDIRLIPSLRSAFETIFWSMVSNEEITNE